MNVRGTRRVAVVTAATVLATAFTGTVVAAAAQTADTVCGPEVNLGSVVYNACSDVLQTRGTVYDTQAFADATNRGIASVNVNVTLQHWNYSTSSWETDSTGNKTIAAGSGTRFFDLPNTWACGQDARERVQFTSPVGTGDWSEVVTPAAC